jgi:hypothetical protein
MRAFFYTTLMLLTLMMFGCSDGGSDAPEPTAAHPAGWIASHDAEAKASPAYADCTVCHGSNLQGSGDVVSCYSCHTFNTAPPLIVHPSNWTNAYADHRAYAALNGYSECNGCHGPGLRGSEAAPSCFSASYEGRNCHANGPGEVPHALDGSFLDPAKHGPMAKADLTICQNCHGEAGGPGDNPRFNAGIFSASGTGCESIECHDVGYAHPTKWAGPNNTFHYSAESVQTACTLCHGESLDGVGAVGVSCLGCHDSATAFTLDCTHCHGYPPEGSADVATESGVDHRDVSQVSYHVVCTMCHGMSETTPGGGFLATTNYKLFNKETDAIGDHWDGNINMNSGVGYNPGNYGCDAAGCHGNTPEFQLSDSKLPVVLKPYVGGN